MKDSEKELNRNPGHEDTISQIKTSEKSITNRLDHLEDRFSGLEDKVYSFENKIDNKEKMLRDHVQDMQKIWDNIETKYKNHWHR